jgi:hypothetical protein
MVRGAGLLAESFLGITGDSLGVLRGNDCIDNRCASKAGSGNGRGRPTADRVCRGDGRRAVLMHDLSTVVPPPEAFDSLLRAREFLPAV